MHLSHGFLILRGYFKFPFHRFLESDTIHTFQKSVGVTVKSGNYDTLECLNKDLSQIKIKIKKPQKLKKTN